jgi:ribosomal protein S27AE
MGEFWDLLLSEASKVKGTCDKCGTLVATLQYHKGRYDCVWRSRLDQGTDLEHLHYTCRLCGYTWTGPTADAGEVANG